MLDASIYDSIIIGGGPAALSAALYLKRQKINFIIVTKNIGGMANYIEEIRTLPLGQDISGFGLLRTIKDQTNEDLIHDGMEVVDLTKDKKNFVINTKNERFLSKSVIIASGRRFRSSNITNEKKFLGKGLSYCGICQGHNYPDKIITVVGGGHSGLFAAEYCSKFARKVILIEQNNDIEHSGKVKELSEKIEKIQNIEILTGTKVLEILGTDIVDAIKVKDMHGEKIIKTDAVFIEIGYQPNTEFVKLVKLNRKKEIIIDRFNSTNIEGIFAAGDVTDVKIKQVIVALGEGAKAALSVSEFLEKNNLIEKAKFR